MDPNATLAQIRDNIAAFASGGDKDDLLAAVMAFQHLDNWLTCGGFPPAKWQPQQKEKP